MLRRARKKAERKDLSVDLLEMDVEDLRFSDHSFDSVVATFVFCSVPDPVKGLREIRRVCKEEGKVLLLEHVRPKTQWIGRTFDLLNVVTTRFMGVNINRETVANVEEAGLRVVRQEPLFRDIIRLIAAIPKHDSKCMNSLRYSRF